MCPECDDLVALEVAKRDVRDRAEAKYFRLRRSGLPLDYRTGARTLNDLPIHAADAVTLCALLGGRLRGLFLWGKAGTFKTSIAAGHLAAQIHAGHSGRYAYVPDLMSDIHASYSAASDETRSQIVERFVATPLLVLDDLGKEKASEHAAVVLLEILDGRYRNWKNGEWLIVTSNFDLDTLCDRFASEEFGDPIRRRIAELTVGVPMERGAA